MEELADLSTIKAEKFDNPFVLSFLSNICSPGSFVPPDYYTVFEFKRLQFTATGQLKAPSDDVKKMIIGGFIICRSFCKELLFNTKKYLPAVDLSPTAVANLELIGSLLYHSYTGFVKRELEVTDDNTAVVTLNEEPLPKEAGIGWKDEMEGSPATTEDLLNGVPDVGGVQVDFQQISNGMEEFLSNMVTYVQMQSENERLPIHKKKLDSMRDMAAKGKRIDPDMYEHVSDGIRHKENDLKIP